jgi:nitroreductase
MDMSNFPELEGPVSFETDEFIRFVRQRRSHRGYRNKAVPRADLEKLVQMCRYIPTGSNLQTVEIKVMTNPQRIKKISDLTVDYFVEMIDQAEKEVSRLVSEGREIPPELAVRREFVNRYSRMKAARDLGLDPILHQAPAVMIFHSAPSPSTPKDDCVIAAQTVVLAAMTLGLGTCYIGLLVKAAADSPAVREALDLPEGNTAHSVLVMGYPRLKFHRAVDRRPIAVQWDE